MSTQMQLRGGTTAENLLFTGAQREVTVDTDKNTLVVQDGITAGGFPLATEEALSDGTFYYNDDTAGGSVANAYILAPKVNTNTPTSYLDGIQLGFTTANPNTGPSSANFQGLGVKSLKYRDGSDPLAGEISGRVYLIYDAVNDWLEIQRKAAAQQPQIRDVSGTVAANALTVKLIAPDVIDFRSSVLSNGTAVTRSITSDLSLVVPAGATLGTSNATPSKIVLVAIDNAGTIELAVVNQAGGANLDETTLINTTAISAGSSSASVFYSAAARSGVPFRVVGVVESTQAIAGTWSTTPSRVQGQGGQAIIGGAKITSATAQPTTAGTSIDFVGLYPGIKRVTVLMNSVSTSGSSLFLVQLGAGAVETTGYLGSVVGGVPANVVSGGTSANGFLVMNAVAAGTSVTALLTIMNVDANTWIASGTGGTTGVASAVLITGVKSLSGVLDRIRLTTISGTDTFDAGSVNIIYEG